MIRHTLSLSPFLLPYPLLVLFCRRKQRQFGHMVEPLFPRLHFPSTYHKLAQIMLDEGAIDHDQAFSLTKHMMQIDLREKIWAADR